MLIFQVHNGKPNGLRAERYANARRVEQLQYGHLRDTVSPDGGGIDVWRGSLREGRCDAVICTVDLMKRDSEIKLLIGCTGEEKEKLIRFHNGLEYMKGRIIRRKNDDTDPRWGVKSENDFLYRQKQ